MECLGSLLCFSEAAPLLWCLLHGRPGFFLGRSMPPKPGPGYAAKHPSPSGGRGVMATLKLHPCDRCAPQMGRMGLREDDRVCCIY